MGCLWTLSHPALSVLTGEKKCRGWYIDENSIDTRFADGNAALIVPDYLSHLVTTTTSTTSTATDNTTSHDDLANKCLCETISDDAEILSSSRRSGGVNLVQCLRHDNYFDIARVVPQSNALDATEEAIVFVVPHPSTFHDGRGTKTPSSLSSSSSSSSSTLMFHRAMVAALHKLADPQVTPWLAKTVFVVRPARHDITTEQTVEAFLNSYSGIPTTAAPAGTFSGGGTRCSAGNPSPSSLLPPSWSGAIIRNLIVMEVVDKSTSPSTSRTAGSNGRQNSALSGVTDLQLKPQGQRGVLPNADLVFLAGMLMEKTSFLNTRLYPKSTFLSHGYVKEYKYVSSFVDRVASEYQTWSKRQQQEGTSRSSDTRQINAIKSWAIDLANLVLFARTMAIGPFPPHAAALDRGIDSVTLSVSFEGVYRRDPSVEIVQFTMEYMVRALSNLHERLHHSHVLYLLPSPKMFVSHMEYFLPNVLILLPLAVRAFGLILPKLKGGMDLTAIGMSLIMTVVAVLSVGDADDDNANDKTSAALRLLYLAFGLFWVRRLHNTTGRFTEDVRVDTASMHSQKDHDGSDKNSNFVVPSNNYADIDENGENESPGDAAKTRIVRTLQFTTCVLGAYTLVPVAFAHTSLAYVPSLIWAPLLAFSDYSSPNRTALAQVKAFLLVVVALATAPPLLLVPAVFEKYTPFVQFAYLPLHLHYFVLVLLSVFR